MIYPSRVVKGFQELGPVHVHVFSSAALGATGVAYTATGVKTQPIFVAGLLSLTAYFIITGAGSTTLRAIPMDDQDVAELPLSSTIGTGIASGAGFLPIAVSLICTSVKLQIISTSTNVITALLFGRTA